jgi:sporulation protein YlmC with PRC-barrel domain
MLTNVMEMLGYAVRATDEEVGEISDFYIDQSEWSVQYVVVDTADWMPTHGVLIPPSEVSSVDWEEEAIELRLSSRDVEEAPEVTSDLPVSLQAEMDLEQYSIWEPEEDETDDDTPLVEPLTATPGGIEGEIDSEPRGRPLLRSADELVGYDVSSSDGEVGPLRDCIIDLDGWLIRYFIVETGSEFRQKKVLVPPDWVTEVEWADLAIRLSVSGQDIKESPEYDTEVPLTREYETKLHRHYDRPGYWEERP